MTRDGKAHLLMSHRVTKTDVTCVACGGVVGRGTKIARLTLTIGVSGTDRPVVFTWKLHPQCTEEFLS